MQFLKFVLFLFILSSSFALYSQEESSESINTDSIANYNEEYDYYESESVIVNNRLSLDFLVAVKVPVGLMTKSFSAIPVGGEISLYKQVFSHMPFYIGSGISLDWYSSKDLSYFDFSVVDGYEYEYSEEFSAKIFGLNIGSKYFSEKSYWIFNPYIQMNIEYRHAFASLNTINVDFDETENTEFIGSNSSLGYEIGIGSLISINTMNLFLNAKISYNSGGGLFLYQRNKEQNVFYVVDYFDRKYIPLGFLTFKVGVTIM